MPKDFMGKIELDIRLDSRSSCSWPRRRPRGANVLYLVGRDLGTDDIFGGPVETRDEEDPRDRRRASNFHTALCSPTGRRCSPVATRRATGWRSPSLNAGFPGISTRIPFENGFISEVLGGARLQHMYRRRHSTPGEECNRGEKANVSAGRVARWSPGETNWYPDRPRRRRGQFSPLPPPLRASSSPDAATPASPRRCRRCRCWRRTRTSRRGSAGSRS